MANEQLANDVFLSMINEGELHERHLEIARESDAAVRLRAYRTRAGIYGRNYARRFDADIPGNDTVRLVAISLDEHYQGHIRDLARNA